MRKAKIGKTIKRRITDGPANMTYTQYKLTNAMSMAEFKAWLEGFSECFKSGSPNKAQWKRIEDRLKLVSIQQEIIYRDRPYWWGNYGLGLISNGISYRDSTFQEPGHVSTPIVTCNAAGANVSNTIMAATAIGQEEAKEFTV